jgi:hypothetical protein
MIAQAGCRWGSPGDVVEISVGQLSCILNRNWLKPQPCPATKEFTDHSQKILDNL